MIFLVLGIFFALIFVSSIIISINDKKYRELEEVLIAISFEINLKVLFLF